MDVGWSCGDERWYQGLTARYDMSYPKRRASLDIQQSRDCLFRLKTPGHGSVNFNEETCRA